jgi:hypothetical protein
MPSIFPTEQNMTESTAQSDHEMNRNTRAVPCSSTILSIQRSEKGSEIEHTRRDDFDQESPKVSLESTKQTEVTTDKMPTDSSIEVLDRQKRSETMDFESEEYDRSSSVHVNYLCAKNMAFVYSILTSAVGK